MRKWSCKTGLSLLLCCVLSFSLFSELGGRAEAAQSDVLFRLKGDEWTSDTGSGPFYTPSGRPYYKFGNLSTSSSLLDLQIKVPQKSVNSTYNYKISLKPWFNMGKISGKYDISVVLQFTDSNNELIKELFITKYYGDLSTSQNTVINSNFEAVSKDFKIPENTYYLRFGVLATMPYGSWGQGGVTDIVLSGYNLDDKLVNSFNEANQHLVDQNQKLEEQHETQKGILQKIKELPETLGNKITELFVPNEQKMQEIQNKFKQLLEDHLGFLYEAPQLVKQIFEKVSAFSPSETPQIILPAFDFTLNGTHVHLWDQQVYRFDFLASAPWSILYGAYKTFIFVMLAIAMINLGIKKYHSIIGGS